MANLLFRILQIIFTKGHVLEGGTYILSQTDINSKEQNVYAEQNERNGNEGNQRHRHRQVIYQCIKALTLQKIENKIRL